MLSDKACAAGVSLHCIAQSVALSQPLGRVRIRWNLDSALQLSTRRTHALSRGPLFAFALFELSSNFPLTRPLTPPLSSQDQAQFPWPQSTHPTCSSVLGEVSCRARGDSAGSGQLVG